jgi:hypothetical protein
VVGSLRRPTDGAEQQGLTINWLPVGVKATPGLTWFREVASGQLPRPNQRSGGRRGIAGMLGPYNAGKRITSG